MLGSGGLIGAGLMIGFGVIIRLRCSVLSIMRGMPSSSMGLLIRGLPVGLMYWSS